MMGKYDIGAVFSEDCKGNTAQLQINEKHGIIGIWKHN